MIRKTQEDLPERTPPEHQSMLGKVDPRAAALPDCRPGPGVTDAQHRALHWLLEHGGSGVRVSPRRVLARGQMRSTDNPEFWERLLATEYLAVEQGRIVLTKQGGDYCRRYPAYKPYQGTRHGRVNPLPHAE